MKKVITTVGTSVITNYLRPEIKVMLGDEYECIAEAVDNLESQDASQYNTSGSSTYIKAIKEVILSKWMKGIDWDLRAECWTTGSSLLFNAAASAEISSILKIKDATEVYLIATDTILSRIASEIIAFTLDGFIKEDGKRLSVFFDTEKDVIKGLKVNDPQAFQEIGLPKLIERLVVLGINKEKIILNITGGYKGLIPFLTILGQVYDNVQIVYLYEESNSIIFIPKLPINFNAGIAEDYAVYLDSEYLVNPVNAAINKELEDNLLVYKEKERYRLTSIGSLLREYVLNNTLFLAKTTLGYGFEVLVFEYYHNKYKGRYDVFRGVKSINNKSIDSDLDLLLSKGNSYICVSVKAFNKLRAKDNYVKALKQFKNHIVFFRNNQLTLLSYHQVVYLYENRNIQEINDQLNGLKSVLIEFFTDASFEVYYVEIPTNQKDPYQNVFNTGLQQNTSMKPYSLI